MSKKTIDPERFALTPEEMAAMQKPVFKKQGIKFYRFERDVLETIIRMNYMPALALVAAVYEGWYRDFKKRNPVKLTSALLAEFKISKDQKSRGLMILEQSGHFTVERFHGHNPLVGMKWIPIKE